MLLPNLPEGALSELLYADDLVQMNESIEELRNKFLKCMEAVESKCLGSVWKAKVMVSAGISKDCLSKNKIDPCGVCILRVNLDSLLCLQCVKWIRSRCA